MMRGACVLAHARASHVLPGAIMSRTRVHRTAFPLVELLVVVGIIAVLIALLLPALNVAREHSKSVQCLSNLRQMVVMSNVYVTNNQGRYPIAYYFTFDGPTTYAHS